MISQELQKQIEQEAKAGQHTYPGTDYGHGFNKGYDSGYKFAGENYAAKWQEAEQRIKELEQWKKEAAALLNPLLDWGQAQKDIPLGCDITKEILRRAKLCTEAQQRAESYKTLLKEWLTLDARIHSSDYIGRLHLRTHESLTPKTGEDE